MNKSPRTLPSFLAFAMLSAAGVTACSDVDPGIDESFGGGSVMDVFLCDQISTSPKGVPSCSGTDLSWQRSSDGGANSWQQSTSFAGQPLHVIGRLSNSHERHQFLLEIDEAPECSGMCDAADYELAYQDLSPSFAAQSSSTSYQWSFPIATEGRFQYRVSSVLAGSCTVSGSFDREDCMVLTSDHYDPEVASTPPVEHESLEIAPACSPEIIAAGECAHYDYSASVPRAYDFNDMRICQSQPTGNGPCAERDPQQLKKGEKFWIQMRLRSVTRYPTLRVSMTNPGQTFGEFLSEPVTSQFELPSNEQYGNAVNGWQYVWGSMYIIVSDLGTDGAGKPLSSRQFDLIPKVFDSETGLTHFEHSATRQVTLHN